MLFNNPNFQQLQNSGNDSQQQQSRLSVQEIMQKYDTNNKKPPTQFPRTTFGKPQEDQRFTFQTDNKQNTSNERQSNGGNYLQGYRLSYGQQINNQPRDSNMQLLKSIDESNLSKVLSEFSILTDGMEDEKNDNNQQAVFQNPIGLHQDTNLQKGINQNQERITFGQTNQILPPQKPKQLPQQQQGFQKNVFQSINIGNETQNLSYTADDELFDDMSVLRDKVLGLLQTYSNEMKQQQNVKMIKQKVKMDASAIACEYSQILDKVNQSDISALSIMEIQGPQYTQKKEGELNMMFNLVEQFLKKFNEGANLSYSKIVEQKEKEIEKKPIRKSQEKENIPIYRQEQVRSLDITIIPTFPHADDSFYMEQTIHVDKLALKLQRLKEQLQKELEKTQLHYTKDILSEMIQNLNEILKANDSKTVKSVVYRIEEGIKRLNLEDQGSIDLYNYMAKAIKATKKRLNEVENSNNQEIKENKNDKQLKRKFFDLALKMKNNLPSSHPGKQMMVSQLYEIFEKKLLSTDEMEDFLKSQLQGQQQ